MHHNEVRRQPFALRIS